jgi:hypothetical protein
MVYLQAASRHRRDAIGLATLDLLLDPGVALKCALGVTFAD